MKQIFLFTMLSITLLFTAASIASENMGVEYELSPRNIIRVMVLNDSPPKLEVVVILNFEESKAFAALTKKNIGNKLEIVCNGRVLTKAMVRDEIERGAIGVLQTNDKEAALSLVRELLP
jgi:preprotein translocase subunit SecD